MAAQSSARGSSAETTAEVVLDFANTHARADGLHDWLHGNGAGATAELDAVERLRDALVIVLLAHSHDPDTGEAEVGAAEAHLREAARRHPLVTAVDRGGAHLGPAQPGVGGALGRVLAAITELALAGAWPRVKACRNTSCHRAFYDRSRNTSGAYCSTGCSTQVNMRAYRRRRSATSR